MRLGALIDLVFPPVCVRCGTDVPHNTVVCTPCEATIGLHTTLFCGVCAARLPEAQKICHKGCPYLLGAATDYHNETVHALVHALKFRFVERAATPLAELLVQYARHLPLPWQEFVVIPVPLSRRRERHRGFNQSALIAERFAAALALPCAPHLLRRRRHTAPQSGLPLAARRHNVADCFVTRGTATAIPRKVMLVDDVTTSGTTLTEATRTLKRAGARAVVALVVARA